MWFPACRIKRRNSAPAKSLRMVVPRLSKQKGFQVLPRRWVVERTPGWLNRYRRLSQDYERLAASSEGMVYIASIQTLLKRLAPHR